MSDPIARFVAVFWASLEPRFPVASGAITIEHDDHGETQDSVFCPSERVCSMPHEVGFVARFGMTSCSPNFFNKRLEERDNMKPNNELLQAVEAQKSVDQDTQPSRLRISAHTR